MQVPNRYSSTGSLIRWGRKGKMKTLSQICMFSGTIYLIYSILWQVTTPLFSLRWRYYWLTKNVSLRNVGRCRIFKLGRNMRKRISLEVDTTPSWAVLHRLHSYDRYWSQQRGERAGRRHDTGRWDRMNRLIGIVIDGKCPVPLCGT